MKYDCAWCKRTFDTSLAQWQHKKDKNHIDYPCSLCLLRFFDEKSREAHHIYEHCYCGPCQRQFRNPHNINQHLKSPTHNGRNVRCVLCFGSFTSAAGLAHHMESGACPMATLRDRDSMYKLMRKKDRYGFIAKRIPAWNGSRDVELATARSWDRRLNAFRCCLCSRLFPFLRSLNQHLQSLSHQEKLYHCKTCGKEFVSLAGVIDHLESDTCRSALCHGMADGVEGLASRQALWFASP